MFEPNLEQVPMALVRQRAPHPGRVWAYSTPSGWVTVVHSSPRGAMLKPVAATAFVGRRRELETLDS